MLAVSLRGAEARKETASMLPSATTVGQRQQNGTPVITPQPHKYLVWNLAGKYIDERCLNLYHMQFSRSFIMANIGSVPLLSLSHFVVTLGIGLGDRYMLRRIDHPTRHDHSNSTPVCLAKCFGPRPNQSLFCISLGENALFHRVCISPARGPSH